MQEAEDIMENRGPNTQINLVKAMAKNIGLPTPVPTRQPTGLGPGSGSAPLDATVEWSYFGQIDLEFGDITIYPQDDGKGGMILTAPPPGAPAVKPCVLQRYDFTAEDGGTITLWFGEHDELLPDEERANQFKGALRLVRKLYWAEPLPPNAKYGMP
ncbi:MAG: hypothetical protein NTY65_16755 [Planctomycetota bacterium]|nr:hypothetical protein [Planctomycetota bacterium]